MPYQKTKEGRLVNEITLGDGYPLSNDKQPLKVGGEASIINVSSPTPDGSVDGEVEVKGKLKAKDTVIQGDLKVFSDSDTSPQFRFESKQGQNCQLQVKSAANTLTKLQLSNNQGSWELKRLASTTSLQFTDGTNTPLTLDGDNVEFTNLTDGSITIDSFVDEDNMSSNSATKIPTQQSVKAYVDNEVAGLVDSAPAALDTLNELAAALNDDASFSTTITNSLATKVGLTGDETVAGHKKFSDDVLIAGAAADPGTTDHVSLGVSGGALRTYTDHGYITIGPQNTNWAHFYTDRANFYFNQPIVIDDGVLASYDEDLILRRDYNDTTYNQITIGDDTLDIKLDNTSRLAIDGDGKVELSNSLMLRGEGGIFVENLGSPTGTSTGYGGSILIPKKGMFRSSASSQTGAIKIHIPRGTGDATDWISMWVDVTDYATDESFSAYIQGYMYKNEPGSESTLTEDHEWTNETAMIFAKKQDRDFTVSYGHDDTDWFVAIGAVDSTWSYLQVTVRDVQIGGSSDIDDYTDDWDITLVTDFGTTVHQAHTDNFPVVKGTNITELGTITTGTWNGGVIASAYLDSDTAHLSGTQTFSGTKTFSNAVTIHTATDAMFNLKAADDSWAYMQFLENDGTRRAYIGMDTDLDRLIINATENGANEIEINTTTVDINANVDISGDLTVNTDLDVTGHIGVGIASPLTPLHIYSTGGSAEGLRFQNAHDTFNMYFEGNDDNEKFILTYVGTGGAEIEVKADGDLLLNASNGDNVGIGTASPSEKLHVSGNAKISADLTVDTDTLHVDSSNNRVGIGTTSPSYGLDVVSTARFQDQVRFYKTSFPQASFSDDSGTDMLQMGQSGEIFYFKTSDTANDIRFRRSDNTDVLNFDMSNARVGIGTTSPDSALHISYSDSTTEGSVTNNFNGVGLQIENTNADGVAAIQFRSSDADGYIFYDDSGSNAGDFHFKTDGGDGASVLTLLDGGNVGIGTESPTNKLQVSHTAADGDNGLMIVREDTSTADGDLLGGIGFDSTDGNVPSSVLESSAFIAAYAAEDQGTGDKGADLVFGATKIDDNDDTVSHEYMRITDTGVVSIGTPATGSPNMALEVVAGANDGILINRNSTSTGSPVEVGFRHTTSAGDAATGMRSYRTNEDTSYDQELRFFTTAGSGGQAEHLTIKHNGKVGIGTTSPTSELHVVGDIQLTGGGNNIVFGDPGDTTSQNYGIKTDANLYLDIDKDNDNTGNFFQFRSNQATTNIMRIKDTGEVGIGTTSPTTTLDVEGTVSYKHTAFTTAGPTDNVDVSGTTVLEVDTSGGSVTIGGFTGGVQGQILYVVKTTSDTYTLKLENNEGGGSQDIFSSDNADISLVRIRGGVTLYCNGTSWFVLNK